MKLVMQVGFGPGHTVRWGPSSPSPQMDTAHNCPLWPNGWMDYDAIWYGDRPQPRRLCVRWGRGIQLPFPKGGRAEPPQFLAVLWPNGCADQYGTWYGGGPRSRPHCARWGPSSPPQKGAQSPNFRVMSTVAKWLYASEYHLVRR